MNDSRQQVEDAIVALLLKWWPRQEQHFIEEARFTARQFLDNYPEIAKAFSNQDLINRMAQAIAERDAGT